MPELKLYDQFCDVLDEFCKDLHLALMTTFDYNTQLIERYILSRLAGLSYKEIKTKGDYENINSNLEKFDVGVFYHFAARGDSEPKKTTVPFLGINPHNLSGNFSENSLFHAKVLLLQDTAYNTFVLTGSANLTFGGWANNIESFAFQKVNDKENARKIIRFFKELYPTSSGQDLIGNRLWDYEAQLDELGLQETDPEWTFHSSFEDNTLLTELSNRGNANTLYYWSPYFSSDLKHSIKQVQEAGFQNLYLIPDQSEGQVKISPENLTAIENQAGVQFMQDEQFAKHGDTLVHAKCMIANDMVGIGSWNFTRSALQLPYGNQNVEAGLLVKAQKDEGLQDLKDNLKPESLSEIKGMNTEEIEQDQVNLNNYSFYCTIAANWETESYELIFPELESLPENFQVWVPANDSNEEWPLLIQIDQIPFEHNRKKLYHNKHFIVYDPEKGQEVFRGLLIEVGKSYRPVYQYETLNDIFISVLQEKGDYDWNRTKPIISQTDEEDDQSGNNIHGLFDEGAKNRMNLSWYNLFNFFKKVRHQIESIGEVGKLLQYKKQRPDAIENIFHLIQKYVNYYLQNKAFQSIQTLPYCWFMLKEAISLGEAYNKCVIDVTTNQKEHYYLENSWLETLKHLKEKVKAQIKKQENTDSAKIDDFLSIIEKDYYASA